MRMFREGVSLVGTMANMTESVIRHGQDPCVGALVYAC